MTEGHRKIHEAVEARYATLAERAAEGESCCSPASCSCECAPASCECECAPASCECECTPEIYDPSVLAGVPVDISGFTLGCGDPVSIAGLRPGETVLDLGSGGGLDCFLAARQVGETGRVIGVDMTEAMLARAEAKRRELGLANVEFRKGTIEALPVEDEAVDVVISNCVVNLSPDKAGVLGEVARVLRPGGRVSISDIVTEGEFTPEMRADLRSWAECVSGAIEAEEYVQLLRDAGLVDVQIADKQDAEGIVERRPGMPRLFSARITARKPSP